MRPLNRRGLRLLSCWWKLLQPSPPVFLLVPQQLALHFLLQPRTPSFCPHRPFRLLPMILYHSSYVWCTRVHSSGKNVRALQPGVFSYFAVSHLNTRNYVPIDLAQVSVCLVLPKQVLLHPKDCRACFGFWLKLPQVSELVPPVHTPPHVFWKSSRTGNNFDTCRGQANDSSGPRMVARILDFDHSWFTNLSRSVLQTRGSDETICDPSLGFKGLAICTSSITRNHVS